MFPKLIQSFLSLNFHHFPNWLFFGIFTFHWSSKWSTFRARMESARKYLRACYRLLHKLTTQICFISNCNKRFSLKLCTFWDVYGHFHAHIDQGSPWPIMARNRFANIQPKQNFETFLILHLTRSRPCKQLAL